MRHVVKIFETGKRYREKDVNVMLADFNEDTAYLRRALVESGYMKRRAVAAPIGAWRHSVAS
ncbi:MAG: DUF2087 domain-containing protein [Chloroflexi bacterium]|nr:DUF2087 domain-containing protein [Chloroflexota bacterium]